MPLNMARHRIAAHVRLRLNRRDMGGRQVSDDVGLAGSDAQDGFLI